MQDNLYQADFGKSTDPEPPDEELPPLESMPDEDEAERFIEVAPEPNGKPKGKGKRKPKAKAGENKRKTANLSDATWMLQAQFGNSLAYNERTHELVFTERPPCFTAHKKFPAAFTDSDITSLVLWYDSAFGLTVSYENALRAALRVGTLRAFDDVKTYLNGLQWDEVERLPTMLADYFGAEDDAWTRAIGLRWMIAAAARVFAPGCQVDTILIAEGPQGIGKSSGFRALAVQDEFFACDLPDIKHKDSVHHLLGPWIIELSELDALNRKEASAIKSFVSRRTDRARLSYGKFSTNHPRRIVFCGSTNESAYNTDATGGRRFWPFKVLRPVDVEAIERDRGQLWAEAVHRYRAGQPWYLEDAELVGLAQREQSDRYKAGTWLEPIEAYAEQRATAPGHITISEILENVLGIELGQHTQVMQNEVARCLSHLGWTRKQRRDDHGKRFWAYVPPLTVTSVPSREKASGDE